MFLPGAVAVPASHHHSFFPQTGYFVSRTPGVPSPLQKENYPAIVRDPTYCIIRELSPCLISSGQFLKDRHLPAFFCHTTGIDILHCHGHLTTPGPSEYYHGYYHKQESGIPPSRDPL
jgi:hypothetical protein